MSKAKTIPANEWEDEDGLYQLDPVFVHSRREALVVVGIFFVFATCTLTTAFTLGSRVSDGEPGVPTFLGMPTWVFWSIVAPWVVANIITGWFCFYYMSDDELDDGHADGHVDGNDAPSGGSSPSVDTTHRTAPPLRR